MSPKEPQEAQSRSAPFSILLDVRGSLVADSAPSTPPDRRHLAHRSQSAVMKPLDPTVRPSRPEFDVHVTENVPVSMRDGVHLATDIYRPARDGRPVAAPLPV